MLKKSLFFLFFSVLAEAESPSSLKDSDSDLEAGSIESQSHSPARTDSLTENSSTSLFVLAEAYEQRKDYKNQVRILNTLKKRAKEEDPEFLLKLAKAFSQAYFKTGDFSLRTESVNLINQLLDLGKKKYKEPAQLVSLRLLKFKADDEDNRYDILQLVRKLIRDFGEKPHYMSDLCKYLYLNKFHKQSTAACRKAIKKQPSAPHNYIYYAWSFGEPRKTKAHLESAGAKFTDSYFVQIKAGSFYLEREEYDKALTFYKRALKLNENSVEAELGAARALFHTRQEESSYQHFLKACLLNKNKALWRFKQAKSILNQKSQFKLAERFEGGIDRCFLQSEKK